MPPALQHARLTRSPQSLPPCQLGPTLKWTNVGTATQLVATSSAPLVFVSALQDCSATRPRAARNEAAAPPSQLLLQPRHEGRGARHARRSRVSLRVCMWVCVCTRVCGFSEVAWRTLSREATGLSTVGRMRSSSGC